MISIFITNIFLSCSPHPLHLALKEESRALHILHWFSSPDLKNWTHEGPVAWGVTSLGLHEQDGQLALTCIQEVRPPNWFEQQDPPVYGYLFDGETFKPHSWSIDDSSTRAFIDPQYFEGRMWYISPTGYTGDPALSPDIPIRSESPGMEHYKNSNLADPSPVRFKDHLYLFASYNAGIIQLEGNPFRPVQSTLNRNSHFNGVTVPFATQIGDEVWLLAQQQIDNRRLPVFSVSSDLKKWSSWKVLAPIPLDIEACSSPVIGTNPKGGWAMFCIEERKPPENHFGFQEPPSGRRP